MPDGQGGSGDVAWFAYAEAGLSDIRQSYPAKWGLGKQHSVASNSKDREKYLGQGQISLSILIDIS
jgi:hypothetical protein